MTLVYLMFSGRIPPLTLLPLFLALSLTLLAQTSVRIVRLTVVNKSQYELYIELKGQTQKGFYYLRVDGRGNATETIREFTVLADHYDVRAWYVYNNIRQCHGGSALDATHSVRLIFPDCNITVPRGDQFVRKYLMRAYIY